MPPTSFTVTFAAALGLVACEGTTDRPSSEAGAEAGGVSGSGGAGDGGGASSTGGEASAGGTGSGGGGGASGGAGAGGNGGGAGCVGLGYCGCAARPDCVVLSEACFCPCGEPCQPSCSCVCGGGAFLGCTAASIATPGLLEGIWLVGWSGGLNHYSWVRLGEDGSADFLDGTAIGTNAPYWPCSGRGSWVLAQKAETVFLALPEGCSTPAPGEALTFTRFRAPQGFPRASVLGASLEVATAGVPLEGWKFPAAQCDEAFTRCDDPFGFPP